MLGAVAAHAQTVITSLPYTISSSGTYVLNSNLNSSQTYGTLITVSASNVTINFQGHYIAGAVGNAGQSTYGITATEQSNITIKNGTIAYCYVGIYLYGNGQSNTNSVDHQIDNMRLTYCYYTGIELVSCPASRVTNCQISQIGSGSIYAFGIYGTGSGATFQNNVVSTIIANTGYGIYATGCFARENTISSASTGVYGGKYQDNLTLNCMLPYTQGIDAGGNN